jgi:hypothetical protein
MQMKLKGLLFLLMPLLFVGCSTITNLTPSQQARNTAGLYPVEAAWSSREQAIRPQSFRPVVMVGEQTFPMQRTSLLKNRWEALIPVPSTQPSSLYRFKFDYEVDAFMQPRAESVLSREYQLKIVDK